MKICCLSQILQLPIIELVCRHAHPVTMSGNTVHTNGVAIIGMPCRFPGAATVDDLWHLLCAEKSMHSTVPSDRFPLDNRWRLDSMHSTFWGNYLENPATFDRQFFNISLREVASIHPQQRLALEVAYEAIDSAGYFDEVSKPRSVGVYVGIGSVVH